MRGVLPLAASQSATYTPGVVCQNRRAASNWLARRAAQFCFCVCVRLSAVDLLAVVFVTCCRARGLQS